MAIKIQEQRPEIPIEIGKLNFAFSVTDESVASFKKNAVEIQKELESIEVDENKENLELCKDVLKRGFDLMLGEGAFEKIYKMTPSVMYLMNYFVQLSKGIHEELQKIGAYESQKQKADKYIRNRNNHNRNKKR